MRDKFINRLMIPIINTKNEVVGFTGRVFPFDQNPNRPKYLNSSESDIFKKGDILYGLDKAKQQIGEKKWLVMVEGNMDVIAGHKYRLFNIIASQGTSVTPNQIKLIKQTRVNKILIAFDNDNAGIISGRKLFFQLVASGFTVYKLVIPTEFKDIDEYLPVLSNKITIDENLEYTHLPIVEYLDYELSLIASNLQSSQKDIQREAIYFYLEILNNCPVLYSQQYLQKLSDFCGINVITLQVLLEEIKAKGSFSVQNKSIDSQEEMESLIDNNKVKKIEASAEVVNFQKFISRMYKQKLKPQHSNKISYLYNLFAFLFPDFFKETDIFTYITKNTDELDLIYTQSLKDTEMMIDIDFNKLKIFIEKNFNKFILDDNLKNYYSQVFLG